VIGSYYRVLKLFSRDFRLFLVGAALVGLSWDGARGVLLNLYLLRMGYGPEFVGLLNGAGALAFSLTCLPAGAMGTRWGSRRLLIVGLAVLSGGFWLLPFGEFLPLPWRTWWLQAATVVTHLGFALFLVNGLPFMMATTGDEERSHAFSFHVGLIPLAGFLGSLVSGALPGVTSSLLAVSLDNPAAYRYPLWLAAAFLLPGVVAMLRTQPAVHDVGKPENPDAGPNQAGPAPIALLVVIGLVMALRFGGRGSITTFFNVYLDTELAAPPVLIGALVAFGQLLSVPAAFAAPYIVSLWGPRRTIAWGTLGTALAAIPLALFPHWMGAGFGYVGSSLMLNVTVGPLRLFGQELVTPRWRSTMAAVFMMGAGLAFSLMSIVGGYAVAALGYRTLFWVAVLLTAAAALLFGLYFARPRGETA
jgi:MFS family permease